MATLFVDKAGHHDARGRVLSPAWAGCDPLCPAVDGMSYVQRSCVVGHLSHTRQIVTFCLLQAMTTMPILLPIHILFSDSDVARKSLLRASISSLTATSGQRFFVLHVILSYWIVISWAGVLFWCARALFRYRAQSIKAYPSAVGSQIEGLPASANLGIDPKRGLRWRTVMVTNIPASLRSEKDLTEYFNYY